MAVKKGLIGFLWYCLISVILIVFLSPLLWMIISSLKTQSQNITFPPVLLFRPYFQNYINVFTQVPFFKYICNSIIVAIATTGLALVFGLPAAYSISRYHQKSLAFTALIGRIAPGISFVLPLYILFSHLKLIDTYPALISTHLIRILPLVIWIMVGFFDDLPTDLEDAARIDGCSILGSFFRVALPLTTPGIAAAAILCFIFSWNDFLFALILTGNKAKTLPVAAYSFIGYGEIDWGGLTAAATVITLPALTLALFIQKHIVKGLTFGAVKG